MMNTKQPLPQQTMQVPLRFHFAMPVQPIRTLAQVREALAAQQQGAAEDERD